MPRGRYSTDIFTEEAVSIVEHHQPSKPLFLYLAYQVGLPILPLPPPSLPPAPQATHAPLEVPAEEFRRTAETGSPERDVYRAMLARWAVGGVPAGRVRASPPGSNIWPRLGH